MGSKSLGMGRPFGHKSESMIRWAKMDTLLARSDLRSSHWGVKSVFTRLHLMIFTATHRQTERRTT
jgi:hypothetical protein